MAQSPHPVVAASSWSRHAGNALRGALIGTAETVPGVSGGTVALVVRVYHTLITSAGQLLSGAARAAADIPRGRGSARALAAFGSVQWAVLVPLVAGMLVAVVGMAQLMEGLVEDYPVRTRALFFGLVLASIWVPFSMSTQAPGSGQGSARWGWRDVVLALSAAAVAYVVVSLPPADVRATPLVIVAAAAVAVSALVLPGLSGSFLLLTFGLYEPTLSAVNDREVAYLALFAGGALVGLGTIVKLLQWLLTHRQRGTLVVLTGLLAGSMRALWPWQDADRTVLAPAEPVTSTVALALLGVMLVIAVLVVERRAISGGRS